MTAEPSMGGQPPRSRSPRRCSTSTGSLETRSSGKCDGTPLWPSGPLTTPSCVLGKPCPASLLSRRVAGYRSTILADVSGTTSVAPNSTPLPSAGTACPMVGAKSQHGYRFLYPQTSDGERGPPVCLSPMERPAPRTPPRFFPGF